MFFGLKFKRFYKSKYFKKGKVMDLTGITLNTADILAVGGLVLGALAAIWPIRRALGLAK
jgi:hypothetical protein